MVVTLPLVKKDQVVLGPGPEKGPKEGPKEGPEKDSEMKADKMRGRFLFLFSVRERMVYSMRGEGIRRSHSDEINRRQNMTMLKDHSMES